MATDTEGQSALHLIANSSVESIHAQRMITLLLKHGCSVGGWSCFSLAVISLVNYITDGVDNQSFAPIHAASHHGHCKMIVALLDGGADVNCVGGSTKETPVVLAVSDLSIQLL